MSGVILLAVCESRSIRFYNWQIEENGDNIVGSRTKFLEKHLCSQDSVHVHSTLLPSPSPPSTNQQSPP